MSPPADETTTASINLLRGWPNPSLLPVSLIKEAASHVLSDTSIAFPGLLYGPDPGYEPCREAVAAWLTSFYNPTTAIDPSRICITGGASQSLGCMLGVYTDPLYTRNIWVVTPAYMLSFRIFEDAGFGSKMRGVPEDEEGIDIEFLRKELQKSEEKAQIEDHVKPEREWAKVYRHVIYCVPAFSNPTSRTMSLRRRRELVKLARRFDALITCDDVYDFLQWPAGENATSGANMDSIQTASLPRLVDIDRELENAAEDGFGNVVSNGTFSKMAGPGLRSGWVEGTAKFAHGVSQAGIQRSGGPPSQLTSTYITRLLQTGQLQKHIDTVLRPAYSSRHQNLTDAIEKYLRPLGFTTPQPNRDVAGGYFVWLGLPEGIKAAELTQKCQQDENLIIAPGNIFEVPEEKQLRFERSIRICFAWEDEWKLSEAVQRIARVTRRLQESGGDPAEGFVVVDAPAEEKKLEAFH